MGGRNSKEEQKNESSESEEKATASKTPDAVGGARPKEASQSSSVSGESSREARRREVEDSRLFSERFKDRKSKARSHGDVQSGAKTIIKNEKSEKLIVMAIDFGTTFSGYAYSWLNNKTNIVTHYWERTNIKTPTVVLLDPQRKFDSFGQDAKNKYMELIKSKKGVHKQWYYFEHFKMKLFVLEGPLDKDMKLADMFDKEINALDVFAAAIEYIKDHFLDKLHNGNDKEKIVTVKDIHFIITVPAIWSDLSKQFMRQAAINAGIPDSALSLALEPEAASLFCKENMKGIPVTPGLKYIVADLGGGTADFTCHEINKDLTLKELQKPSGGDYGGTTVDNAFRRVLIGIFGGNILHTFKNKHMDQYCDLFDAFQVKKKAFDGKNRLILTIPLELRKIYEDEVDESVDKTLSSSPYKGRIEFKLDKMFISEGLAKDIFDEAVQKIVDKTTELVRGEDAIDAIVMVGGFSESPYLKDRMNKTFDGKKLYDSKKTLHVLSPGEPASAVIKGAVLYGHQPKAIDSRICKYSYGIARMMRFKDYHKESKRVIINGVDWCDNLFNKHIEVGQTVRTDDDFKAEEYFPVTGEMRQAVLEVYASPNHNPTYIDDPGCQLVGLIRIDLTGGDVKAKVLVKMIFGGTELRVEAKEEKTGNLTIGHVDFLG